MGTMQIVWIEDDATVSHPDHERVEDAWERLFGEELDYTKALGVNNAASDETWYSMPGGLLVRNSYPGNDAIYTISHSSPGPKAPVTSDHEVTDTEFFTALQDIALYGDVDSLPVELGVVPWCVSLPLSDWDREAVLRARMAMLFAQLARGEQLPQTLGAPANVVIVNRWMQQRVK